MSPASLRIFSPEGVKQLQAIASVVIIASIAVISAYLCIQQKSVILTSNELSYTAEKPINRYSFTNETHQLIRYNGNIMDKSCWVFGTVRSVIDMSNYFDNELAISMRTKNTATVLKTVANRYIGQNPQFGASFYAYQKNGIRQDHHFRFVFNFHEIFPLAPLQSKYPIMGQAFGAKQSQT